MTPFTSSSFVFDRVISVLRLPQTPSLGKTSREVLHAFINLIGPLQLAIHVVKKKKKTVLLVSKTRTGRRQTKKITIFNDASLCLSCPSASLALQNNGFVPRASLDTDKTLH